MRRRAGFRPWAKSGEPWAFVRTILHDKAKWHGHGAFYLPLDHRSPRRAAVGDRACVTGGSISVYDSCPTGVISRSLVRFSPKGRKRLTVRKRPTIHVCDISVADDMFAL